MSKTAIPGASRSLADPLRVTLAISSLRGGGAERVVAWLASQLAADGHGVTLVLDSPSETDFYQCDPRVRIVRTGRATGRRGVGAMLRRARDYLRRPKDTHAVVDNGGVDQRTRHRAAFGSHVRRLAVEQRADAVLSFVDETNLSVLRAMEGSGVPVIVEEVSQPFARATLDPVRQRLRPLLYQHAHALVVPSHEVCALARARWPGTHPVVIPNAMCLEVAKPLADRPKHVLSVGSLRAVKDHLTLIEAWALSEARTRGWRLKIVGEGPLRPELEAAVERFGIGDTVSLPGATRAIAAEYAAAALFVLPSRVEGFGNALVEAMAHGCACIATSCPGGPTEILSGGEHGLLVPPGDPEALAAALDRITLDDPLRRQLAAAALARSKAYDPQDVYLLWKAAIHRAVAAGSRAANAEAVNQAPTEAQTVGPMRVMLVSESLWGGTGRVISWLASRLANDGHSVTLVLRSREGTDWYVPDARVRVLREPPERGARTPAAPAGGRVRSVGSDVMRMFARGIRRLLRAARSMIRVGGTVIGLFEDRHFAGAIHHAAIDQDSDVVVSFLRRTNIAVLAGMWRSPVPVIVSERSHPFAYEDLDGLRRKLRPILYRRAERVVVLTDEIAALAERKWAISRPTVIQNAIPIAVPADVPAIDDRERLVLCVGRLHPHKDQLTLIEAWARSDAAACGWKLMIVGEGALRGRLEREIDRLGIGASVSLPGATTDILPYYLAARVFVLPSVLEGFPNALIEAMACGCACIASACPGATREILDEGAHGLLVPPQDPDALADALDRLTLDPALCRRLGDAALARSSAYVADKIYAKWIAILGAAQGKKHSMAKAACGGASGHSGQCPDFGG